MELPVKLKTGDEMYAYSCENGFGTGLSKGWGKNNFRLLEQRMEPDETAFLTFVGLHRFHSMSSHQRNFAYAVTDRRIMMGQVRSFGRIRFESFPLNSILNMSLNSDANAIGVLTLMFTNGSLMIGMGPDVAEALGKKLQEVLPLIQELARDMAEKEIEKNEN